MSQKIQGVVKTIYSGDTIVIGHPTNKQEKTISLALISAPKLGKKEKDEPSEPYALESRDFVKKNISKKNVEIEVLYTNPKLKRDFCVVSFDGKNLNQLLLEQGLAVVNKPKTKEGETLLTDLETQFEKVELKAREKKVGQFSGKTPEEKKKESDPVTLFKTYKGKPLKVVVEKVLTATCLIIQLPTEESLKVFLTGIKVTNDVYQKKEKDQKNVKNVEKVNGEKVNGEKVKEERKNDYSAEAKKITENAVKSQNFTFIFEHHDTVLNKIFGTLLTEKDKVACEELLLQGVANLQESSLTHTKYAKSLRAAQLEAQKQKVKYWSTFVFDSTLLPVDKKTLSGIVVFIQSGDSFTVKYDDGKEENLQLSSVRAPPKDTQMAEESKESLRKKIIGKRVTIKVDYRRDLPEKKEVKKEVKDVKEKVKELKVEPKQKRTVTITENGKNISVEQTIGGFLKVLRHGSHEERSSCYDQLLKAESEAMALNKGVHRKDEKEAKKVHDLSQEKTTTRLKSFFDKLKEKSLKAVIEKVLNGSRFKVLIPSENLAIIFSLCGVSSPSMGKTGDEPKPFAKEAKDYSNFNLMQRDVEISVENLDEKSGCFQGSLKLEGKDFALNLLENGFVTVNGSIQHSKNQSEIKRVEVNAKKNKKNIFSLPPPEREDKRQKDDVSGPAFRVSQEKGSLKVRVTEISGADRIYIQTSDSSKNLEDIDKLINALNLNDSIRNKEWAPKQYDTVLCQFKDDKNWYRAKVLTVEKKDTFLVSYIDYGNRETVKGDVMRPLKDEGLKKIAPQAKEAHLAYIALHPNSSQEALKDVKEFCLGNDLIARYEYTNKSKVYFSIFDVDGKFGLNADLVRNGLAFVSTDYNLTQGDFKDSFTKQLTELNRLQDEAKKEKLGLWVNGDIYDDEE